MRNELLNPGHRDLSLCRVRPFYSACRFKTQNACSDVNKLSRGIGQYRGCLMGQWRPLLSLTFSSEVAIPSSYIRE